MNRFKKSVRRSREFVSRHRVGIAVVTTAVICTKLNSKAIAAHDDFLRDEGLFEKFYNPEK